jgi:hypothetical protein
MIGRCRRPVCPVCRPARADSTEVFRRLGGGNSLVAGARIRPRLLERSPTPLPPSSKPLSRRSTKGRCDRGGPRVRARGRRPPPRTVSRSRHGCHPYSHRSRSGLFVGISRCTASKSPAPTEPQEEAAKKKRAASRWMPPVDCSRTVCFRGSGGNHGLEVLQSTNADLDAGRLGRTVL